MQINAELAEQIRSKARSILNREILISNNQGLVLAGASFRGRFVPEALKCSQDKMRLASILDGQTVEWCPFVYDGNTLGSFGILTEGTKPTAEVVSLLSGLAEVIVHQHFLLDRIQSAGVVKADFIKDVLESPQVNTEEVYRQADILQLNLRSPQSVILIHLNGFESQLHAKVSNLSHEEQRIELTNATERINDIVRRGFKNFQHNVSCYLENDKFGLLKGIGGENLNTLNTIRFMKEKASYVFDLLKSAVSGTELTIGVGQYYPDLGGLRKSYHEAELALRVGLKVWGSKKVYHIKQVGMFTALTNVSQDRKAELAHQILHPLLRDQQLFKTVQTFLANGLSLTEAAQKLHIHRNTLIYRLDKTKKLINLDPRHFEDALQIKLGLMFYQEA